MSDAPDPTDDAARERDLRSLLGLPTQSADELRRLYADTLAGVAPGVIRPELLKLIQLARRSEALAALRANPGGVPYVHLSPRE